MLVKKLFLLGLMGCVAFAETFAQDMQIGNASYYSDKLHGRRMSNGEMYNRDSMTCAHLKYPLGTKLKVRNPLNNREVIVEVTDRGPHTKRFIIDLSRAAARHLGIITAGFSQVEITPYHKNEIPYRMEEDIEEIPELDLEYNIVATYPNPAWKPQTDSIPSNTRSTILPATQKRADSSQKPDTVGSGR